MSEEKAPNQSLAVVSENQELSLIVPIRNETVFSQFPLHRLSKGKASLSLQITKANEKGKVITAWKVIPSAEYGEPGILAYKLDTLFINRLIDDARPDIPEVIKLGSLREIAKEIGAGEKNTNKVKNALYQNAFAGIKAELSYTNNDGRSKFIKFGSSRYAVIFTGETLPNGKEADAVYIVLTPLFRDVLRTAKTRPLDYSYLKGLPPTAQRLYELISPKIFAALKYENPRAKYLYSDLCKYAPLTRYESWEQVKKQLYKVHQPHKKSGYLLKVEFEQTTDENGTIDWEIWYTPGRKAKAEYRAFNTREGKLELRRELELRRDRQPRPHSITAELIDEAIKASEESREEPDQLVSRLMAHGITEGKAIGLARNHREAAELELEAFPHRDKKAIKEPAAWLIRAIESGGYSQPAKLVAKRQQKTAQEQQKKREEIREHLRVEFTAYLKTELKALKNRHKEAFDVFSKDFEQYWEFGCRDLKPDKRDMMQTYYFEKFAEENPGLEVLTFWQWAEKNHPNLLKQASPGAQKTPSSKRF